MKTLSPDTSLKAEQFQIDLIRKAPIFRRLQLVDSLIKTTRHLSWQGILERYPNETYGFYVERYISFLYNDDSLARKVKNHVVNRNRIL